MVLCSKSDILSPILQDGFWHAYVLCFCLFFIYKISFESLWGVRFVHPFSFLSGQVFFLFLFFFLNYYFFACLFVYICVCMFLLSFVFVLRFVFSLLTMSLDCWYLIAPSVFLKFLNHSYNYKLWDFDILKQYIIILD